MAETRIDFQGFHWLDIGNPTPEALNTIAAQYDLHPTSVQDCLQPEHLPKFELIGEVGFVVLRSFDRDCPAQADTVQELTRKIAVFFSDRFIITVHRKDHVFLDSVIPKWSKRASDPSVTADHILADLLLEAVKSYEKPVLECMSELELFEMEIFGASRAPKRFRLKKGYYLKRKVSVYRRMLRATLEPVNRVMGGAELGLQPHFQNVRELIDGLYFYCDEIAESVSALLNLHISLASQRTNEASQRTNEVMRVLTVFSCFFLPINFIASIYGMNFAHMPELHWQYGYYLALGLMTLVAVSIFVWFRRRGWLRAKRGAVAR